MFSGLMSRWKKPCLCMKARPWKIWYMTFLILLSGKWRSRFFITSYRFISMYSKTKNNSSFSRITSFSLTMFGWFSFFMMATSFAIICAGPWSLLSFPLVRILFASSRLFTTLMAYRLLSRVLSTSFTLPKVPFPRDLMMMY